MENKAAVFILHYVIIIRLIEPQCAAFHGLDPFRCSRTGTFWWSSAGASGFLPSAVSLLTVLSRQNSTEDAMIKKLMIEVMNAP